jgi:deoxyribodipyrimidine photo-lyase
MPLPTAIEPERIRSLNEHPVREGDFVLYWMQSSLRTEENPALACAVGRADSLHLPVVACFALDPAYPDANLRHYRFLLDGIEDVRDSLEALGIRLVLRIGRPDEVVGAVVKDAAVVVVDRGYLRHHRAWYAAVAAGVPCRLVQVEGNVVVPVETASPKEEYSAATLRPKLARQLDRFLHEHPTRPPERSSLGLELPSETADTVLKELSIDSSVPPAPGYTGGESEAVRRFETFLDHDLDGFAMNRNDPAQGGGSSTSPYLHYGQVSPVTLALRALARESAGASAFIEQLVVRRELAHNFVLYNERYDEYACLPRWVKTTLDAHRDDPRPIEYTPDELERAATHDPYWNAAQRSLVERGTMHGYMRMYWGKKCLEWSATPESAYATAVRFNDRYALDGRDPNGYAGIAWCFGKHDRPWRERPIFGMVRYMNANGLERKFDMAKYLEQVGR